MHDLHLPLPQLVFLAHTMLDRGALLLFACVLFGIDCVVHRVQDVSLRVGRTFSAWIYKKRLTDEDPLLGPIQAKKWKEQSWQLFVHFGFTIMELIILYDATWWQDTRTCWIPHPEEQLKIHSPLFKFFYLSQLGVWIYTCFVHR